MGNGDTGTIFKPERKSFQRTPSVYLDADYGFCHRRYFGADVTCLAVGLIG
jgi:hypothetical protein